MGQVEACFSPFGDSVSLSKIGARFAPNAPLDHKSVWMQLMVLLGDVGELEAHFSWFGDSVNLNAR